MPHKVLLGIEHLMTGVMVRPSKGDDVLTFERESPSIVRVTCDSPIEVYWPVTQSLIESEEVPDTAKTKYSHGEAEWYAQAVAPEMVAIDEIARQQYVNHNTPFCGDDVKPLPDAVIKAMRRKHGKDANQYIRLLRYGMGYWSYTYKGMYLGVEPDGYIHS